ncbi:MAG: D-aminoacyl-tRNA deacylase [Caldimicrobium sp.]
MRVVLQRVKEARVVIEGQIFNEIKKGLLVLACIEREDTEEALSWMAEKIASIRIFPDEAGKFNRNIKDVGGEVLVISNFTLCGELKKGTRPSFHLAEEPILAQGKLNRFIQMLREKGLVVKEGQFGAYMDVELINDGPVTIILQR